MNKLDQLLAAIELMDAYELLDLLMDDKALLQIPDVICAVSIRNDVLKAGE